LVPTAIIPHPYPLAGSWGSVGKPDFPASLLEGRVRARLSLTFSSMQNEKESRTCRTHRRVVDRGDKCLCDACGRVKLRGERMWRSVHKSRCPGARATETRPLCTAFPREKRQFIHKRHELSTNTGYLSTDKGRALPTQPTAHIQSYLNSKTPGSQKAPGVWTVWRSVGGAQPEHL
jgi:hypothetical protein